jgi:hypothetical protein
MAGYAWVFDKDGAVSYTDPTGHTTALPHAEQKIAGQPVGDALIMTWEPKGQKYSIWEAGAEWEGDTLISGRLVQVKYRTKEFVRAGALYNVYIHMPSASIGTTAEGLCARPCRSAPDSPTCDNVACHALKQGVLFPDTMLQELGALCAFAGEQRGEFCHAAPTAESNCEATGYPIADAQKACEHLHGEFYNDCVFDACAEGKQSIKPYVSPPHADTLPLSLV